MKKKSNVEVVSGQETTSERSAKKGRPFSSATGEGKTQKITIYMTPSFETDIKDLAAVCGEKTITPIILSFLEQQIQEKSSEIEKLRQIRAGIAL